VIIGSSPSLVSSPTQGADPFLHPALLYRDEAEYLAGTVPFIVDGLAADEPVAVSVPGPNLAKIRRELGSLASRVRLLDMTEAGRNPARILPGVLHAAADPFPDRHVRIIGEPIWATRTEHEYPACLQHEALINGAFRGRRVTILCPYDVTSLDPSVVADAHRTHPVLIEADGRHRLSDDYSPSQVIEATNVSLPEPAAERVRTVNFDITGLSAARRAAAEEASRAGLELERVDDVRLAVGELIANSVRHGAGSGTLRVWAEGHMLVAEVRDVGRICDPLAGRRPAPTDQLGGRGLLLVNHVADLARTHTGPDGTETRIYFRS